MFMFLLSVGSTAGLAWLLTRLDRDHAGLRVGAMAALACSSIWMVWMLVEVGPLASRFGMALRPDPVVVQPEPVVDPKTTFKGKLGEAGLTGIRMCLMLAIASLVLAVWRHRAVWGRVFRVVLAVLLLALAIVLKAAVLFSEAWNPNVDDEFWHESVLLTLSLVLLCVAIVRQGIADSMPWLPAGLKSKNRKR